MPKARKPPQPKPQQLLVEGKNDLHVIWALCEQHKLPETFSVEVPLEEYGQGIEVLLAELCLKKLTVLLLLDIKKPPKQELKCSN